MGFFTTKTSDRNNFVRLVPGSSESENSRDLRVVREALKSHRVTFKEEKVIAISNIPSGVPGVFSSLYGSLWCKVEVKSFYIGEKDIIFLNVSNIKRALQILLEENVKQCPNEC